MPHRRQCPVIERHGMASEGSVKVRVCNSITPGQEVDGVRNKILAQGRELESSAIIKRRTRPAGRTQTIRVD